MYNLFNARDTIARNIADAPLVNPERIEWNESRSKSEMHLTSLRLDIARQALQKQEIFQHTVHININISRQASIQLLE